MIIAFVPVRLKSSRLPNKALKEIYGVPAIERCLINTLAIPGVEKVLLATSTNPEDDALEEFNHKDKIEVVRGSEEDVLARIMPSLDLLKPDHVMRITGDCPLVSTELGEITIKQHLQNNSDATFTLSKVALGIASEIYKLDALLKLKKLKPETKYSEYLIYYFSNNPNHFKINIFDAPERFLKPWRLTLDEENDLKLLNLIFRNLGVNRRPVRFSEVESFFATNPKASSINHGNVVKYRDNKELIDFLKKETTL